MSEDAACLQALFASPSGQTVSVIQFPDRVERMKAKIATRWRRELIVAGMKVPEAEMQRALDLLVPGVCALMETDLASSEA